MKTVIKTTEVEAIVSFLEGQVTFFNSTRTSRKNCLEVCKNSLIFSISSFPAIKNYYSLAGQEGFEPPSPGFGVRCSSR